MLAVGLQILGAGLVIAVFTVAFGVAGFLASAGVGAFACGYALERGL